MSEKANPILSTNLSKDGGGFLYVELVPRASLGALAQKGATRPSGAHLDVPLTCHPENLPAGDVPCLVRWKIPDAKEFDGSPATLAVAAGTVTPRLDLVAPDAATARALGKLLENGGPVSVTVTPDHPFADGATATLKNEKLADVPELSLRLSWNGEPGAKLGSLAASKAKLRIGDVVTLELHRSSWQCAVRVKVTAATDDHQVSEVDIDFGPKETHKTWQVGYSHGVLQLPAKVEPKKKGAAPKDLAFHLDLQVSEDGKSFGTIASAEITVPCPSLDDLHVELGDGVQKALQRGAVHSLEDFDLSTILDDHSVWIAGKMSGIAPGAELPFVMELWGYSPIAPGFMHPLLTYRPAVGRLDATGEFRVSAEVVTTQESLASLQGLVPFAVLRAQAGAPLQPMPSALQHGLRLFGDEDFTQKAPGLGVCSSEIGTDTKATREPLIGKVWWDIDHASRLVLSCRVFGSQKTWESAKFIVASLRPPPEGPKPRALELPATYAQVAGSETGVLTAKIDLKQAGPIAGFRTKATVEPKIKAQVLPNEGETTFEAKPAITSVTWAVDEDTKHRRRIHLVCNTHFFPRDGRNLDVVLETSAAGVWSAEKAEELSYGSNAKGVVDADGRLDAFVTKPATIDRLLPLLASGSVRVKVSRPPKTEKLYDIPGFTVAPFEGPPVPASTK